MTPWSPPCGVRANSPTCSASRHPGETHGLLHNAGLFLLNVIFGLYIFAVLLRFLLQLVRADFRNPIAQFLVTITNRRSNRCAA